MGLCSYPLFFGTIGKDNIVPKLPEGLLQIELGEPDCSFPHIDTIHEAEELRQLLDTSIHVETKIYDPFGYCWRIMETKWEKKCRLS
jgi:hypothetical protein